MCILQISAAEVPWTKQEEDILKEAVERYQGVSQHPIRTWHLHSSILNASVPARGRNRMGKHCMEYWNARLGAPQDQAQQQQQQKVRSRIRILLRVCMHDGCAKFMYDTTATAAKSQFMHSNDRCVTFMYGAMAIAAEGHLICSIIASDSCMYGTATTSAEGLLTFSHAASSL